MIAVASGKGGTGKTTVTLGLAAALGRQRASAIAVDLDLEMPNLHAVAGVDRTPTVAENFEGHPVPNAPGVKVIPAPVRSTNVSRLLNRYTASGDLVLLDCPAGASRTAVEPMRLADAVLLVTTPGRNAVRDTLKTAAMARALQTPVIGVVINKSEHAPSGIDRCFDAPLIGCIPTVQKPNPTSTRFTGFLGDTAIGVRRLYDTLKTPD